MAETGANSAGARPALLALDFDGVVCDSAGETCLSAWRAFRSLWPDAPEAPPATLVEAFPRLRPLIETGWENVLLVRLFVDGVAESEIGADFQERWCPLLLERHGLAVDDLVHRFGAARDAWLAEDAAGWVASNRFYPGVAEQLRAWIADGPPVYVITTKQERFAAALLEAAGATLPPGHLFALEAGPKARVLERLAREHGIAPDAMWFLEDRLKTLHKVARVPALAGLGLFFAEWGYNTESEREQARRDPGVSPISLAHFCGPLEAWIA